MMDFHSNGAINTDVSGRFVSVRTEFAVKLFLDNLFGGSTGKLLRIILL